MTIARLSALLLLPALAAASGGDSFDLAVSALTSGSRAEAARDMRRLRGAVAELRGSGALPSDGGEDVLARWTRAAKVPAFPPDRERVLGPGYRTLDLQGGGVVRFEQTFLAGQRARVAIVSVRSAPFAMHVTGDDRQMICKASAPHGRCDWVPDHTARFAIELRNPAHLAARYFVIMQ